MKFIFAILFFFEIGVTGVRASILVEPYAKDLINSADAIGIVKIHDYIYQKGEGSVLLKGKDTPTFLTVFTTSTVKTIKGPLPASPIIVQFDSVDRFDKKEYLVFLKAAKGIYFSIYPHFEITDSTILWYQPIFKEGGYGPFKKQQSVSSVISQIDSLLGKPDKAEQGAAANP